MTELKEKDFIQERYGKDPYPFWFWFFVLAAFTVGLWFVEGWFNSEVRTEYRHNPFLRVTNRELSVFLWQFPEKMRVNAPQKGNYLPAFQYEEKVSLFPDQADVWASAPPELLFLYHTWKRQIGDIWFPREISKGEFIGFVNYAEEWKPEFWKEAPQEYVEFFKGINGIDGGKDVAGELPLVVRQAFQGWKNFFKEGEAIEKSRPTDGDVEMLVKAHPFFARQYWRNMYPTYLRGEKPPFLKVALFNMTHS